MQTEVIAEYLYTVKSNLSTGIEVSGRLPYFWKSSDYISYAILYYNEVRIYD